MQSARSLRSRASQDTFISLLQLEPSPMDKDLPPLPEDEEAELTVLPARLSSGGAAASVGLSGGAAAAASANNSNGNGGRHGPIFYLVRIQRYSSYAFSIFATLHLATTSVIPLVTRSVPSSESSLLLAREIYQTPLSEPLLVALPVLAHVAAGFALRLVRRSQNLRRYGGATPALYPALHATKTVVDEDGSSSSSSPSALASAAAHAKSLAFLSSSSSSSHHRHAWPRVSYISLSGYGFAALTAAHVFANRGLPLLAEGDSANIGLAYVSHGFARHPVIAWAAYAGLLALGCGHMAWGWARWLGVADSASWALDRPTGNAVFDRKARRRRRGLFFAVNGAAAAAAFLWAAGGLAVVATAGPQPGWVGELYDGLFGRIPGL